MSKFSAAKMSGAQDIKMQNAFNQLIDLLDSGYVAESMMGGHKVRVVVDPKGGMQILSDGVQVGGIILVNGSPTMVSGAITNDATDPECWATIGEITIDGVACKGFFLYRKSISSTVPAARILINAGGDILLYDKNTKLRFSAEAGATRLYDATGKSVFYTDAAVARISLSGSINNAIYLTDSAPYFLLNGVAHPISYT